MNYPAAELRGLKMNFYLINPDAEHRGILLIKSQKNADYSLIIILTSSSLIFSLSLSKRENRFSISNIFVSWFIPLEKQRNYNINDLFMGK
jgi:hypothetical protein